MGNKKPAGAGWVWALKSPRGAGFLIIVQKGLENLNLWFRERWATHHRLIPLISGVDFHITEHRCARAKCPAMEGIVQTQLEVRADHIDVMRSYIELPEQWYAIQEKFTESSVVRLPVNV